MRKIPLKRSLALVCLFVAASASHAHAQQPFFTDNADVADRHRWHLESNNEFDVLPVSSFPNLRQDTHTVKFSFGAFRNCEVGMDFPVIAIFNATGSGLGTPLGFGDADFSIKYNFRKERDGSRWPGPTFGPQPVTGSSATSRSPAMSAIASNRSVSPAK